MSEEWSDPVWATPTLIATVAREAGPADGRPCDDCGRGIRLGGRSYITHDGQSRRYCDPCARVRTAQGWEFDARPLAVLRREVA